MKGWYTMKQKSTKFRHRKLIALFLATTLICCMAITAHASSYSFSHNVDIRSQGSTTVHEAEYDGNNIRVNVSTAVDTAHSAFNGKAYTLQIQKKGWWVWQWDTVATKTCYFGQDASLASYGGGSGRYRVVIQNNYVYNSGVYVTSFSSNSWS